MDYIEKGSKEYRSVLTCMLLGSIVTFAILYAPQPLITLFSKQYGVSPSTASASISLPTLTLAFSLLFVPFLSRRIGRKQVMGFSLFVTSLLAILSSFAPNFTTFLVIRLFEGISVSGFPAIAIAYLNEEISRTNVGGTMGAYVAGTAVGGFVGRVLVGPLTDLYSWEVSFLDLGVVSLFFSVWFWFSLPNSRHFHVEKMLFMQWISAFTKGLKNRALFPLYCIGFLIMGAYVMLFNYIGYPLTRPPYDLSQTELGFIFTVNLVGAWSSMNFGRLADGHSRKELMVLACAIFVVGTVLTLVPNLWIKILGIAVFAYGFFGAHTTASGWVGVRAPAERKATASSLYLIFYYVGSSFVGWFGGFAWQLMNWTGPALLACVLMIFCYLLAQLVEKKRPGPQND